MLEWESALDLPELNALLPEATETQLDRLVFAVGEGRTDLVGPLMTQVSAAGLAPVAILIGAARHFRVLLGLATASDGTGAALARLRPPVYGPRRDALAAQARSWSAERLETANRLLFQTDRQLRSAGSRPDHAMVERCLVRLSMMAGPRRAD
jgi:DNA polymerase-3 subunit delta